MQHRVDSFNQVYFEQSEYFDFMTDKFDLYIIKYCMHFVEVEDEGLSGESNIYVDVMRDIQTRSTFIFFLLIHIPLSRLNSMCCFITAMVPLMLNLKTQYWFYEKCNKIVCFFFRGDKEAVNYVQKPKHLQFKSKVFRDTLDNTPVSGSGIILTKLEIEM